MIWRIDVFPQKDKSCHEFTSQIKDLGIKEAVEVYFKKVYFLEADLSDQDESDFGKKEAEVELIVSQLLIDPVIEKYAIKKSIFSHQPAFNEVLITYNPGVCDSVALSLEKAIRDMSFEFKNTRTARYYRFEGLEREKIEYLAPKILFNPLIEHVVEYEKVESLKTLDEFAGRDYKFNLIVVDVLSAQEKELRDISLKGCLSLSLDEMKIVQDYFKKQERNPTDCELETIAVLWSEHCAHKTFKGIINYEEKDKEGKSLKEVRIDSLLKSTVMKATREINSPDCVSVFSDNAGVVKFDDKNNICFKVETHNHPSSLEPYGGASTGMGGVIRDILGTGCSARPFASIDVFCFSGWHISYEVLPKGLLHPKRVIKGVIRGVRDYGNRMGIPTVAGAVLFDERFLGNPLVYCGTLGIIPSDKSFKKAESGDLIILCGAPTGRDGIHGATFSSKELDEETIGLNSAVQIGNPIEEKKLTEAILRARDSNLFNAITDCGAGGISSAITELASEHGAEVYLDKVPLKYRGLQYTEIWISESQERMVIFAKEDSLKELKQIFQEEDVELTVVGRVTNSKKLIIFYEENKVCELDMDFIFNLPRWEKKAVWISREEKDIPLPVKDNYNEDLKKLLSSPNISCKDWVIREYDHEVQGGSVVKSVYGMLNTVVSDGAVLRPDLSSEKCVAVGVGINPFYSDIDPYWMAGLSIDEALRNVVCAGGKLNKTFILDNFSWGSPLDESVLGGLVRAAFACYDFSTYYKVPFISGKDSLYNEYSVEGKRISIPGTLLISAVSIVNDWQKVLTSSFKKEGNLVYIAGFTKSQLGASEYFRSLKIKDGKVPKIDKKISRTVLERVSTVIDKKLAVSCHDLSEGGLGVAVAEMCMGSGLGVNVFLGRVPKDPDMFDYEIMFSESPTRFIIEVEQENKAAVEEILADVPFGVIGCVSLANRMVVYNRENTEIINLEIKSLRQSWMETFREFRYEEERE